MRAHGTLHIPDVREQNDFPTLGSAAAARTFLSAPLRQQGEIVGTLTARRTEVRPFTPAQIKLLETFADQAVIAHRERAAVQRVGGAQPRSHRGPGATNGNQQDSRSNRQFADRYPTGLGGNRGERDASVRCNDAHISHVDGDVLRLNAHMTDASLQREVPITRGVSLVRRYSTGELSNP